MEVLERAENEAEPEGKFLIYLEADSTGNGRVTSVACKNVAKGDAMLRLAPPIGDPINFAYDDVRDIVFAQK